MYNRKELLTVINEIEKKDKSILWKSKQHKTKGQSLKCTYRRLQQLTDIEILNPITFVKQHSMYDETSVDRYIEISRLHKQGFTLPQLQNHFKGKVSINKIDLSDFEDRQLTKEDKTKILNTIEQLTKLLKDNL
jgi:predicted GTPase